MQALCKILVYMAVWKRPHITEICFAGLNRLRKHPDFNIDVLAVISEEEMIPLCERYNVKWVMHENRPLAKKKNFGLKAARHYEIDFMLEIGSDDLVTDSLLTSYKEFLKYDFFGIRDVAYINSEDGACRRLTSKSTYGAGRMISRKVLEKMNWKLWDDHKEKGLDNNSVFRLAREGIFYRQVPAMPAPGVIDIKSDVNIWAFNYLLGAEYDINLVYEQLSEEEIELIECCKVESI